jgi:hypothetical protein
VVTNNSPVYHVAQLFEQIFIPPAVAANKCNVELPLDSDSPDPKIAIPYSYLVSSVNVDELEVKSGNNVRLYVQGNIELKGNAGISSETNSLQIYGSNAAGINGPSVNYSLPSDSTDYTTEQISLSGNANIDAFVFAPAAIAGVDGGAKKVEPVQIIKVVDSVAQCGLTLGRGTFFRI